MPEQGYCCLKVNEVVVDEVQWLGPVQRGVAQQGIVLARQQPQSLGAETDEGQAQPEQDDEREQML